MSPYHKERLEWEKELAACSDEELISKHNHSVDLRCFGFARQIYLGCLERELLARSFDSCILFERDDAGQVTKYRLPFEVEIMEIGGRRVLVPKAKKREESARASG